PLRAHLAVGVQGENLALLAGELLLFRAAGEETVQRAVQTAQLLALAHQEREEIRRVLRRIGRGHRSRKRHRHWSARVLLRFPAAWKWAAAAVRSVCLWG